MSWQMHWTDEDESRVGYLITTATHRPVAFCPGAGECRARAAANATLIAAAPELLKRLHIMSEFVQVALDQARARGDCHASLDYLDAQLADAKLAIATAEGFTR